MTALLPRYGVNICCGVGHGVRQHALADGSRVEHAIDHVHIKIDHGVAALAEQGELAREVILKGGVLDGRDVSSLMLVNAPTSNSTPATRPYLSAWLDDSITTSREPSFHALRQIEVEPQGSGDVRLGHDAAATVVDKDGGDEGARLALVLARSLSKIPLR